MSPNNFYKIRPLPESFLEKVRLLELDDQDQPVEFHIAKGGEPCRDVLRAARPGERLILASYSPFTKNGPYKEFGPIFLLADEDVATAWPRRLPVMDDRDYFGNQFVLRAYSAEERIVDAVLSRHDTYDRDLHKLFEDERVTFVLARFAAYGCYGCRIERASFLQNTRHEVQQ